MIKLTVEVCAEDLYAALAALDGLALDLQIENRKKTTLPPSIDINTTDATVACKINTINPKGE